jgi:hypothetical protein
MSKRPQHSDKGKLIYHSREESAMKKGDSPATVIEKSVTHSEENLFCKYYEKKGDSATRITVKSSTSGGVYTLTVKKGAGEPKVTTHNKKEIMDFLRKDKELGFMMEYIEKTKSLSRPKRSSKKGSKKRSKKGSKKRSRSASRPRKSKKGSKKSSKKRRSRSASRPRKSKKASSKKGSKKSSKKRSRSASRPRKSKKASSKKRSKSSRRR